MWKRFSWLERVKRHRAEQDIQEREALRGPDDPMQALFDAADHVPAEEEGLPEFKKRVVRGFKQLSREVRGVREDVKASFKSLSEKLLGQQEQVQIGIQRTHRTAVERLDHSDRAIVGLNEEVVALRKYIADQQEQLRRYQDGYAWTITKDLCQRIIVCIDDIVKLLKDEGVQGSHREHLTSISQQLLYALSGSGVEQTELEPGCDFKKVREFAKMVGKDPAPSPEHAGQVSSVDAPGYVLYVTEKEIRPVRPTLVRVYSVEAEGTPHE